MSDAHWLGARAPMMPIAEVEALRRTHAVPMRDGVPIAIDVFVPRAAAPLATIVRQTRYARSLVPRGALGRLAVSVIDHNLKMRRAFLAAGFAWVDVDVRGSGASGGTQPFPWHPGEVRDGAQVVDWIVGQPWSNKLVGSLGVSYDGTCAEMLLVNQHPAVRAVAPLFALFDAYTDIAFPGGVHLAWFTEHWGKFNAMLDRNATHEAFAQAIAMMGEAKLRRKLPQRAIAAVLARLQRGVRPVEGHALADVVAAHAANYDVHEGASKITHRDDRALIATHPNDTIDSFSPRAFADRTKASGAAVYSYSGWRDGAYASSAIARYATLGGRLTLGPWSHGGRLELAPFAAGTTTSFDHAAELVGFFAHHLQGKPAPGDGRAVHYFTMGEGKWKAADTWPPPRTQARTLYLGARSLVDAAPTVDARDRHEVDPTAGSGPRTRWRCMIAPVPPDYPDRADRDAKLACYDSAPLPAPLEVTGTPSVTLHLGIDTDDAAIFVYVEDVAPDGKVAHVTEGNLRALHRAPARTFRREHAAPITPGEVTTLTFDLLPVSYRYAAGHRIRLAIAGADADNFAPISAPTLEIHRTRSHASHLSLSVVTPAG